MRAFLDQVNDDQDLLVQLSPASMDLFDAFARDREHVRHGCVVARVRPQGFEAVRRVGLDPYGQATHALFVALHRICAGVDVAVFPPLEPEQSSMLLQAFGELPAASDNDGIVPALSQVHGEVIHAAWADHLDLVGHFHDPAHDPPHYDWLASGSGFNRRAFDALWEDVARFIAGAA